ncbi:tubulin--tyrosine ligase-like protein 12 [Tribolium madens]|uniref:tubulin--tyrosine ligase-like protein 12 n=1 Tax=Tribolium madens TaxID=41895 RepID=UPI001CF7250F|nr:tubulin--tyrosine ligase-like protein 12 [Tribolium madens]
MGRTFGLDAFLNLHRDQLTSSGIPEIYWSTLNEKIQTQLFNAGETFQLLQIDYERERLPHEPAWGLQAITDIDKSDPKHIYLIDHAWTFRVSHAKNQLLQFDSLRSRLCNILGLNDNLPKEEVAERVFTDIWKLCNTYSIGNAENIEERLPVWYVMDEIGSAVMHSDTPNCRVVPFVHVDAQITYSLLFPIADVSEEEFIFADFAEGVQDLVQKRAALLPWVPHEFDMSFEPEMPGPDYYLSGHIKESLPDLSQLNQSQNKRDKYKVFTEYSLIKEFLTDTRFEFVDEEDKADILWLTCHFKDFSKLSEAPQKFVNQFPFEYVITVKDLLCLTCRKSAKTQNHSMESSKWFPVTYNLRTEIGNFVSYFQHRKGQENFWIIKPYNLARSLDIHITDNLNYIMRLPATGPKIAQKYISNPVLFNRPECGSVKFDIRYVILLKSVKPLKAYVYSEFFVRFANKPFELKDFHDFEKHFTVMNYEQNVELKHMLCSEFRIFWEQQYPNFAWEGIQKSILGVLRTVLEGAVKEEPPCGIAHSPQSRALYAADLMLEWGESREIQPKLLEINWTPDCKRACQYYPNFYNDIFKLLFLDESSNVFIKL